ncbi:MAG: IS3 family transposase [Metallibacterium scheffleri]
MQHADTGQQASDDIGDYIENFYNRTRRHQHLAGVSPEQFEAAAQL